MWLGWKILKYYGTMYQEFGHSDTIEYQQHHIINNYGWAFLISCNRLGASHACAALCGPLNRLVVLIYWHDRVGSSPINHIGRENSGKETKTTRELEEGKEILMDIESVLHMVGGAGETSYANNSSLQKIAISKARPVVEDSILDLYCSSYPESLNIADLGCSSGPNTLSVIKEIIDATHEKCRQLGRPMPELRVFLNDLPGNDFNTIFRSLPVFYGRLEEEKGLPPWKCFIAGVPGSFYGRLFPRNFLDFVHSSYSVHWLSQVPKGLQGEIGEALNKGHVYMAESSPPAVFKAYLEQFQRDFSLFLKFRSEEMISGGRMVVTLLGRKGEEPSSGDCCHAWELLAQALREMVSQGVVQEAKLDSYNSPHYTPSVKELKGVINMEGSFHLDQLQITEVNWDPNDRDDNEGYIFHKKAAGRNVAKYIRAVAESMLTSHFGQEIIDELFERYAVNVGEHLAKEKTKNVNFTFSMTKKV